MRSLAASVAFFALCFAGAGAHAQELEPRAYGNIPVGLNFLIAGYTYAEGGLATDPSVPLDDAELETDGAVLAYAHAFGLWGSSAKVDVVIPHAWLSGTATFAGQPAEREVSGFGDPRLRFSYLFYGAPALTLEEFATFRQGLIIGASLQAFVPLGQYDSDKFVNIGSNRWAFKPELGISQAWGPVTLEVQPGVTFYADNRDYPIRRTREQDPIYSVQSHLIYNWRPGIWAALDGTWYTGGRTSVDGVRGDDLQSNTRVGATLALSVSRKHSVKLYASTGASTRTGTDFDIFGIALQYRWGGGL